MLWGDFPGDIVVKNLPSNIGETSLIPGMGTRIPHALGNYWASGGDGIPAQLFQILKDDAVKVLYSIYQQI